MESLPALLFSDAMKLLPILLLTVLLALPAHAARRVGEVEVRAGANGVPCFTISRREEQRGGAPDFQAVTVSDSSGKPMWKMAMPRERTFPVTHSMCIPYAGRVQALPQTPAAALEPGKAYQVLIDARKAKNAGSPLRYLAWFCLAPGSAPAGTGISPIGMRGDCQPGKKTVPGQSR
ncbi:hypothetical protein LK540_20825 [Massilia sp. IC2-278]|uniref:hypothetical protein n=1 Tax=Massilia sp. IC2-278 TaxID=2887200 RepID=UPI001E517051|nr:hypothetical protein [Massilia sp. IC2-278]MCC2962881.1 hypothetical protein [Massilia sp. IC2-278]